MDTKMQQLRVLTEISKKMDTLRNIEKNTELLKQLTQCVSELSHLPDAIKAMNEDIRTLKSECETLRKIQEERSEGERTDPCKAQVKTYIDLLIKEREHNQISSDAYAFRKAHKRRWSNIVNTRKMAYFNSIRAAGIASTYEHLLTKDTVYIPKKNSGQNLSQESRIHKSNA